MKDSDYVAPSFVLGFALGICFALGTAYLAVAFVKKVQVDLPPYVAEETKLLKPPVEKVSK